MLTGMAGREEFLGRVTTTLYDAELALHNGDAGPRRAIWSRTEPVSVLGAWRNAYGQGEVDELFTALGRSFSACTSYAFELQAYDVVGDMAYTVGLEHTSASVEGDPRSYTLRVTQVYRREGGKWTPAQRLPQLPSGRLHSGHRPDPRRRGTLADQRRSSSSW
jgi:ketosteroid isomerase-like protein